MSNIDPYLKKEEAMKVKEKAVIKNKLKKIVALFKNGKKYKVDCKARRQQKTKIVENRRNSHARPDTVPVLQRSRKLHRLQEYRNTQ